MTYLSAADILSNGAKLATEDVDVPELGGTVIVSELSALEADDYSASLSRTVTSPVNKNEQVTVPALENARARLVCRCLVDPSGARLFKDNEAGKLGALSSAVIGQLYDVAIKLSKIGDDEVEAVVGESEAVPSDGSPSNSASSSDTPPDDIS